VKVYILPTAPNKVLLKLLFNLSIRNDFSAMTSRLSMYLRSQKLNHVMRHQQLLLLIDKIYLSNIFKYTEAESASWFVTSLHNRQIGWELNVNPLPISEFFRPLMGMGINEHDVTEIENLIARDLNNYLTARYNEESAHFNEIFVGIFDMFHIHIPLKQVNVHRFELTPALAPIVFCTDKLPCLNAA
jgi:hypothetical protein